MRAHQEKRFSRSSFSFSIAKMLAHPSVTRKVCKSSNGFFFLPLPKTVYCSRKNYLIVIFHIRDCFLRVQRILSGNVSAHSGNFTDTQTQMSKFSIKHCKNGISGHTNSCKSTEPNSRTKQAK